MMNGKVGLIAACAALALLLAAIAYRIIDQQNAGLPDAQDLAEASIPQTLEEMQAATQTDPDDGLAWQRLGLAYFDRNMFAEAAQAYDRAAQLAPANASLWAALGEALTYASEDDPLPQEALTAFRRAIAADPAEPRARYFLAVEKDLAGDHEGAIADWLALLADTAPGAPWENDLVRTIEQVGTLRDIAVAERIVAASATRNILPSAATGGIPGPTQQQMTAASALSPSQQQNMAEGMVERLAARLENDPSDVEGWIMLMRSYQTLERGAQAQEAYAAGVAANPQSAQILQEAAETLGI